MEQKKKKVSIYSIAEELQVSASTVSRALQDHPSISTKIKERIRKKAKELNYKPNRAAINLKLGKSNTIGVVVPDVSKNFFASSIDGIEDEAYRGGYDVLICQSKELYNREKKIFNALSQGKVDGVIVSIAAETTDFTHINNLIESDIPVVMFDRASNKVNACSVTVDDYQGAHEVVEHLLEQGFRRIFHFAGPQHVGIWRNRLRGYRDALEEQGISPKEDWIYYGETSKEEGMKMARQILAKPREEWPDAIFSTSDFSALGIILEMRANGINIPEEIGIAGFANEPFDTLIHPTLSSVDQSSRIMGQVATQMLIKQMQNEPQINRVINPELIVRESSRKR